VSQRSRSPEYLRETSLRGTLRGSIDAALEQYNFATIAQMSQTPLMKETGLHWEKFEALEKQAEQPAWVFPMRKAGMARFAETGFHTLNDEDWRFTNVSPIARLPFKPVFKLKRDDISRDALAELSLGRLAGIRLVFINGHYAEELSSGANELEGKVVKNLASALVSESSLMQRHLGKLTQESDNPFSALNAAFFLDGAFVHIPAGAKIETPIHLLFLSTMTETGATSSPRNLILVDKGGQATVIETYISTVEDAVYFTNAVTEIVLEEGATLEHCKFQNESLSAFHMAGIYSHLGRNCNLVSHSIATGARLSRNNIRTSLAGEGVECVLNGLYLTRDEQLADHHMVVEHAQPHCNSHEYYNGILDGRSKGVFHGRILVRQAAQKTDAKQTNKNLLLSDDATVDTKPQLEIYADDVKCTHGATVGQLNEESIFYLRSRGLSAERARRMLIHAFASEIIQRIRLAPVREELDKVIWDRLEANPQVGEKR